MPATTLNGIDHIPTMTMNVKKMKSMDFCNGTTKEQTKQFIIDDNNNNNEDNFIKKHHISNGNGHIKTEEIKETPTDKYGPNYTTKGLLPAEIGTDYQFKRKVVWFNAIGFLILHLCALYGYYLCFTSAKWQTIVWMLFVTFAAGEGVTVGAHRLYSHKAFKAVFIVRLALVILQTIAGQNCMYIWVRDHRQHHKYSDTDADPHNAKRGFFFSHIGWLMSRKHPAVKSKGQTIDMSDLEADSIVMIQKMFYKPLYTLFALALPVAIPVHFWGETYWNSLFVSYFGRYMLLLNITWLVNSAAHLYGTRPYDKTLQPVESKFVGYLSVGEGWHNYHHAFPYDYRAAELGIRFSPTTLVIDILAKLGLVYDLKTASKNLIEKRTTRLGDGTHPVWGEYTDSNHKQVHNGVDSLRSTVPEEDDRWFDSKNIQEENNNSLKKRVTTLA